MTIEAILERIATALERQASAFEAPMRAVHAAQAAPVPAPAEPVKRGPGRPPKAEQPSLLPPVEPPVADSSSFLDDEPSAAEPEPTIDDVRKALVDYGKRPGCSQEKARSLLKQHGHVDILKALKQEHFKAVIDAARA